MTRVLVVEDEESYSDALGYLLRKEGYDVAIASTGPEALAEFERHGADIVLLDLMLPGIPGTEVCRQLRASSTVPVIMVSAKDDEVDKVVGLELGADDYITKPFSPKELVARVRALLRRLERVVPIAGSLTYGPLAIDLDRHIVSVDGRETRLTAKEFLLLQYLMTHRGRVLSRDLLLSDVWDYSYTGGTRTVDVHVRRLREKLPFLVEALVTVKQFGYKLVEPAPVAAAPDRAASPS